MQNRLVRKYCFVFLLLMAVRLPLLYAADISEPVSNAEMVNTVPVEGSVAPSGMMSSFEPLGQISPAMVDPNEGSSPGSHLSLGGFFGIHSCFDKSERSNDICYAGGTIQVTFKSRWSMFFAIGGFFNGRFLPVEVSLEYSFPGIYTRGNAGRTFNSGSFSVSVVGDPQYVFFTMGPGVLFNIPLKNNAADDFSVTTKLNMMVSYAPAEDFPFSVYFRISPGWTHFKRESDSTTMKKDYFSLGFMVGFQIRLF